MSSPIYCSGTFVGQRIFDESINLNKTEENDLMLTLCFTPTKEYPSLFGASFNQSSSSSNIIHGIYDGTTHKASMIEFLNGTSTYEYDYKLIVDPTNGNIALNGVWKSLINSNLFGKFSVIYQKDISSNLISGIWIGQSDPDEELKDFYLPVNPIRWCFTLFKTNNNCKLFGTGYFNDSADIPNQPLLFFSLNGYGTLDEMNIIKKYTNIDYSVEYKGKFIKDQHENYTCEGRWNNPLAGSYGSFLAKQVTLNPLTSCRLDICICEVCRNALNPGDNRWCCFDCHFSTCHGCHLNPLALEHKHELVVSILPNQKIADGNSCAQLVENAFELFHSSPFIIYRDNQTDEFISINYGEMSIKCFKLQKYWKEFVSNANDENRPVILLISETSPAYICCLLTGILLECVILPIHPSSNIDLIKHLLSTTNPSIIIIGEIYLQNILPILSEEQRKSLTIIYKNEEQFKQTQINNNDFISLTKAFQLGEQNKKDLICKSNLSSKTISAILSTSGSTGYPKGAIFTEELMLPNDSFTLISPFIRIDYQPFDPVILLSLLSTIKYGSCRGLTNLNNMWNDIKYIKPTSLGLTPSLWNFIYKNYLSKLNQNLSQIQKENIEKEMREDLGGRLIVGTSGGGAISPNVLHFIKYKLKIDLVDMYGCRECGNITRDGIIYPGIDVKLIPVEDYPEFDGINMGEICVHSPKMIQGYWNIDKNSSFIQIQGKTFYKTGDIGYLEGNTIKLIDRSGTMIKNSMGEWISPVKIENIIEQLSQISSAFVMGHSNSSYLVAIICPSQSGSTLNHIDMLQLIRFHCFHCGLHGPEIPQAIFIEKNIIWNELNGLMKEKKSRHALSNYYSQIKIDLFNQQLNYENIQNNQLNEEFINILENILNRSLKGQINGENTFLEIGADSLSISLLSKIYNDRGIFIDKSTIYNHSLYHIQQLLTNKNLIYDQIIEDINWKHQSTLPTNIKNLISTSKSLQNKHILLTGGTGFLGPILLTEILQKTADDVIIYCLIRATDDQHAKQRLTKDLEKCQRINSIDWNRIHCIVGDVSKQNLGLSVDLYNKLTEEIGFIYHNATYVHLDMPYKALKPSNVQGTLNALELALKCNGRFIYTSSVAALPSGNASKEDSDGWVNVTSNEINKKDGYGQTKVVCEQLLREASTLGADIVIIRPCTVSADTITGFSNPSDFINILLYTQIEMNTIVENSNMKLHVVPVDYCAKAIVALAMNYDSRGKCFNLYGNQFCISKIYEILLNKLPNINFKKIKQNQWKEFVLNNLSEKSLAWPLRERIASVQFLNENRQLQQEQEGVPTQMTRDFLQTKCHLQWFQITEQDFIKSIDYMIKQELFSKNIS